MKDPLLVFLTCLYFILGEDISCPERKSCVPIQSCIKIMSIIEKMKELPHSSFLRSRVMAWLKDRICGGPTDGTICCDLEDDDAEHVNSSVVVKNLTKTQKQSRNGPPDFVTFSSNILSLQWNSNHSNEVEMTSSSNCMFEGIFENEPSSKVLLSLTRCSNSSLILQIHSEKVGDMLVSFANGKPVIANNVKGREVISRSSRSATKEEESIYDDILVDDDDLSFEISDSAPEVSPPIALLLHLNVYLAKDWLRLHRSYAHETAAQVVKHAGMILQHHSLDTKIVLENRTFELDENVKINKKMKGFGTFSKLLKAPFVISGSPVVHILLSDNENSRAVGVARLGSVCSPPAGEKPMAVIKWVRNTYRTVITLAHEIGHILGMGHDWLNSYGREKCGKGKNSGSTLMNYGEPRDTWSRCSNQDFKNYYSKIVNLKGEFCLKETNLPGWGQWGEWSSCSRSCGRGMWTRSRQCYGDNCRNRRMSQSRFCNLKPC